jgi:DNA-binding response OmpR family regulator
MADNLNILIVEDNDELRETTRHVLEDEGYCVTALSCAEELPEQYALFDLALIDLNLPGEDGLSLARRIRKTHPNIGLIMITARRLPEDRSRGYINGADIYLVKPVGLEELLAAIGALRRRLTPSVGGSALSLNLQGLFLSCDDGTRVALLANEATLLAALVTSQNQRLELSVMIEILGKEGAADPKSALELQIVRLRKKLKQAGAQDPVIQSIRGWGYQLCPDIVLE